MDKTHREYERLSAIAMQCAALDRHISCYLAVPHYEANDHIRAIYRAQYIERMETLLQSLKEEME